MSKKDSLERKKIWTAIETIFSDESSFWTRFSIHHTWSIHTNRFILRTVKHPVKVHVWSCFSKQGFGTLHIFTDNFNAAK